jgi:secreted trypsin-like serine protease
LSLRGRLTLALACACATLAFSASPSLAVVGGNDASPGEYPAVAEITFGAFLCTGTLVTPNYVLSAGHCGSVTGAAVATPASWPAPLINVRIGGVTQSDGENRSARRVVMHPNYWFFQQKDILTAGYDVSLIELSSASTKAAVQVSGASETALWSPGTMETIVGWGATEEGGDLPDRLQEAQVPITTDAYCDNAYEGTFDAATMVCAGFPEGGVDTCQGDSGGPMFGRTSGGTLRVVGTTSWGNGCARKGFPGVYGRVGDSILRNWVSSNVPAAVAG